MAMIELSIHKDYVPKWGAWEGIREVFQNAMDEHDRGNPMSMEHKGSMLKVGNVGSELTAQHLLIGYSDKRDQRGMRGTHGEGLDLRLLALVREGFDVEVQTPTENWRPVIAKSEVYGVDVLFIRTRKVQHRRCGTTVVINGVSEELWNQIRFRFLAFHDEEAQDKITVDYYGDLLLNPVYRGQVYVKGIYVQSDHELEFGYNFHSVDLDRARRMVGDFDLKWGMNAILGSAIKRRPDVLAKKIWNMINNEAKDVAGFGQYTDAEAKEILADQFRQEHGDEAVPVANIGESEEMASYGANGVVAPRVLREVIAGNIDTPQAIKEKAEKATIQTYSWGDLDDDEKATLKAVTGRLDRAMKSLRGNLSLSKILGTHTLYGLEAMSTIDCLDVVNFRTETVVGMYDPKLGKVQLARKCLQNYYMTLRVLVHEFGHKISRAGDATYQHEIATEDLWTAVTYVGNGDYNA